MNYQKFMPGDRLIVHWFGLSDFARLVANYVSHGEDMPIGAFLELFRGFSSRAKASAVREALPAQVRRLSDLDDYDVRSLYYEMRNVVKEPSHNVLGSPIGKQHLVGALRRSYGSFAAGRHWYATAKTTLNGAPAVVEAAVVETTQDWDVHIGINHSPTYTDPLSENYLYHTSGNLEISGYGIKGFLQDSRAYNYDTKTAVAVHITAAAPTTLDAGKTRMSVSGEDFEEALEKVLWSVSKDLYKESKKRERDAAAAERDAERRLEADNKRSSSKRIPKFEACFEVMEEAYAYATGNESLPTTARDLYYAVRNRIERFGYDADELSDN